MIKEHRAFEPISKDTIIWQYMPFIKFISLLREQKLYFNRIDNFKDKTECTLTAIDKKIFRYTKDSESYWDNERKRHFINCWIESDYELALMWETYGKDGIAIKTTIGDLYNALAQDKDNTQYIARVKYIDEQNESSQDIGTAKNALKVPMTKRKYYEQEKEIRLLYVWYDNEDQIGIKFPLDLTCLIKDVRVYSGASQYFLDVVNKELELSEIKVVAQFSKI